MGGMVLISSCSDNDLVMPDGSGDSDMNAEEGFSIGFSVSLDNMGGPATRISAVYNDAKLQEYENYVDLEKFRVLFFDSDDKFLFESKNRWVKKLDTGSDPAASEWYVSVPLYTYGNELNWDWNTIRTALTSGSFKIALLVNRPDKDWYPGFKNTGMENGEIAGWIDNRGPDWGPEMTGKKDIFDLHHCQYDKLYHGKSYSNGINNFYDFIMEDFSGSYSSMQPKMGATSSWVDWNGESSMKSGKKAFKMPDKDHPIPMYGLQVFNAIDSEKWRKGTTFVLNRKGEDNSIALLRSVVRLELWIPKNTTGVSDVGFIGLCYPNIYARCEPMNNWTPTDQLWAEENSGNEYNIESCKEMASILEYGPICKDGDGTSTNTSTSKRDYQQRLAWFYGEWLKKGWNFGTHSGNVLTNTYVENMVSQHGPSPKIFNSCIQRNTVVFCDNSKISDNNYYRYVVYTGERNINDPSALDKLGDNGGGKPTVLYWMFNQGSKLYGLPITDYSNSSNPAYSIPTMSYSSASPPETHDYVNTYENENKVANTGYMQKVMKQTDPKNLPWPLIRNHVYVIKLAKTKADTGTLADFAITSEDLHSEDITRVPGI